MFSRERVVAKSRRSPHGCVPGPRPGGLGPPAGGGGSAANAREQAHAKRMTLIMLAPQWVV